jgi:hypothetical protein
MAEKITLTVPLVTHYAVSDYEVTGVFVGRNPFKLTIYYRDSLGNEFSDETVGDAAEPLVKALNKANLSIKSLERRALEKLQADGRISAGSVTGSPE